MDIANRTKASESDRITPSKAASILGVSVRTVYSMGESGKLTAYKLPSGHRRYERSEVEALADGGKSE